MRHKIVEELYKVKSSPNKLSVRRASRPRFYATPWSSLDLLHVIYCTRASWLASLISSPTPTAGGSYVYTPFSLAFIASRILEVTSLAGIPPPSVPRCLADPCTRPVHLGFSTTPRVSRPDGQFAPLCVAVFTCHKTMMRSRSVSSNSRVIIHMCACVRVCLCLLYMYPRVDPAQSKKTRMTHSTALLHRLQMLSTKLPTFEVVLA